MVIGFKLNYRCVVSISRRFAQLYDLPWGTQTVFQEVLRTPKAISTRACNEQSNHQEDSADHLAHSKFLAGSSLSRDFFAITKR